MEDKLVDWMSKGQSAILPMISHNTNFGDVNAGTPYAPLHIIQWPSEISADTYDTLLDHIRFLLSRAQAVAVAGVADEVPIEWVEADIASMMTGRRTFLGMPIMWQSKFTMTTQRKVLTKSD